MLYLLSYALACRLQIGQRRLRCLQRRARGVKCKPPLANDEKGPPRGGPPFPARASFDQANAARSPREARRPPKPSAAKPTPIISQVAGSGMVAIVSRSTT